MNVFVRAAVVAAIVATGTFTVNAAVRSITNYDFIEDISNRISVLFDKDLNEKDDVVDYFENSTTTTQLTTHPTTGDDETTINNNVILVGNDATTTTVQSTTVPSTTAQSTTQQSTTAPTTVQPTTVPTTYPDEHIETTVPTGNDPVEDQKELTGLYVNSANMKTAYIFDESLSYDGLILIRLYSDGSMKSLDYRDCKRTSNIDTSKVGDYTVKLEYQNTTAQISVTVRPNEETRFSEVCSNDEYDYFLVSKGAIVTKYKGDSKNITVDNIDGNPVYSIEQNVFKSSDIVSFSSNTCQRIMDSAFENATDLKNVDIPNCTYIGSRAFRHTAIEDITIPNGVTEINDYTFDGCESLVNVNLKGDVTRIGRLAFNECYALESITGTSKIKRVEELAFYDDKLMELDSTLDNLMYAGDYAFAYCNSAVLDTIDNMTYIGDGAFMYCYNISTVHIGGNIDVVPAETFRGTRITELTLDEGITAIGNYAFMSTQIKDLVLPNSIKTIGTYAFYTNKITSVKGGENAEKIESMAFYPNRRLTMYVKDKSKMYDYAVDNGITYILC